MGKIFLTLSMEEEDFVGDPITFSLTFDEYIFLDTILSIEGDERQEVDGVKTVFGEYTFLDTIDLPTPAVLMITLPPSDCWVITKIETVTVKSRNSHIHSNHRLWNSTVWMK